MADDNFTGAVEGLIQLVKDVQELTNQNIKLKKENEALKEQNKILTWRLHEQD